MTSAPQRRSLFHLYPRRWDAPLLLVAASVTLGVGMSLPFMEVKQLFFFQAQYSLMHSIQAMWDGRLYLLAVVIFCFSIFFPITKLITLFILWFTPTEVGTRQNVLKWLGWLGKWSMLDVFVVALLVVLTQARGLVDATPGVGVYIFGLGISLSIIATLLVDHLAARADAKP